MQAESETGWNRNYLHQTMLCQMRFFRKEVCLRSCHIANSVVPNTWHLRVKLKFRRRKFTTPINCSGQLNSKLPRNFFGSTWVVKVSKNCNFFGSNSIKTCRFRHARISLDSFYKLSKNCLVFRDFSLSSWYLSFMFVTHVKARVLIIRFRLSVGAHTWVGLSTGNVFL